MPGRPSRKNLEIANVIDENVPGVLLGDFDRLRQVLINLMGNAVKFTHEGEVSIYVSIVDDTAESTQVQFEVIDTGVGIEQNAQQKIFDAFSQADGSTTRRFGGTGLGLAISRQLTQLMGGEIGVDSTPEEGSRFWLRLPFLKPRRGSTPLRSVLPLPRMANVLLCDDSALVARSLGSMLTGEQVRLDLADTSEKAATRIHGAAENGRPYDVILLDGSLRNCAGVEDADSIIHLLEGQSSRLVLLNNNAPSRPLETRSRQNVLSLAKPLRKSALMDCLKLLLTDSVSKVRELRPRPKFRSEDFAGARILVVEDNPANQDVARGMLERLGCVATIACDGVECIEALRDTVFRAGVDGCSDATHGRIRGHAPDPGNEQRRRKHADRRHDRQCPARRRCELRKSRHE